jgi:hypothetical protein
MAEKQKFSGVITCGHCANRAPMPIVLGLFCCVDERLEPDFFGISHVFDSPDPFLL